MDKKSIVFTQHALARARERKLWKYVSKDKFFYDSEYYKWNMTKLEKCIYAYKIIGEKTLIITMFEEGMPT